MIYYVSNDTIWIVDFWTDATILPNWLQGSNNLLLSLCPFKISAFCVRKKTWKTLICAFRAFCVRQKTKENPDLCCLLFEQSF